MKPKIMAMGLMASALLLGACHQQPPTVTPSNAAQPIQQHGVQVIQQDQRLTVVIPTDRFFVPQSTVLRAGRLTTLQRIAQFVKQYANSGKHRSRIRVYGFTDKVFSFKQRRALSEDYAHAVAAFLWNAGIPRRRIIVRGYGATHPIGNNRTVPGSAVNRRVEIVVEG